MSRLLPRVPISPDMIGPWDDLIAAVVEKPQEARSLVGKLRGAKQQVVMLNQRLDEILRALDDSGGSAGGAVALSNAAPEAVAATPSAGVATEAARADHVHQGVTSIFARAYTSGPVRFTGYVTQTGNVFAFGASGAPASLVYESLDSQVTGAASSFTLTYEAVDISHIYLYLQGQLLFVTGGNLTSGQRILSWTAATKTIALASAVAAGRALRVWYWKV